MNMQKLKDLLDAECAGMDDLAATAHLNAIISIPGHLTLSKDLLKYNAASGVVIKIEDDSIDVDSTTRSVSHATLLALKGYGIDFSDQDNIAALDNLVANGVLADTDKAVLTSISTKDTTLAIEAGFSIVKLGRVMEARV